MYLLSRQHSDLYAWLYVCMYVYIHLHKRKEVILLDTQLLLLQTFNEHLKAHMNEGKILSMVSRSNEFEQLKVPIKHDCSPVYSLNC